MLANPFDPNPNPCYLHVIYIENLKTLTLGRNGAITQVIYMLSTPIQPWCDSLSLHMSVTIRPCALFLRRTTTMLRARVARIHDTGPDFGYSDTPPAKNLNGSIRMITLGIAWPC